MNIEQIQATLQEIARPFADRRLHVFEITPVSLEGDQLVLQGRVLQVTDREVLRRDLLARFPNLQVDLTQVAVGRQQPPQMRVVATNLTSLHVGTTFITELMSQLLNGAAVEVLWEQGNWGFVRQEDGYLGWTYLPYLTDLPAAQPTHLVTAPVALLRQASRSDAEIITRVFGGTAVCVDDASGDWQPVTLAGGVRGWLPQADLRALDALPQTAEARQVQLMEDALRLTGVPYLWGGSSANGIDCSGLAQLLHRWVGLNIPRDADLQYAAGKAVDPPFAVGDLLFFGETGEQRRITHVGISLGGWRIIHSSRTRNGVHVDDVQSVTHLRESFLCAASYIHKA